MVKLNLPLERLGGEHRAALEWFGANRGKIIPWSEIKGHTEKGARLVNQAKGIYKPHYTDYALSIRQTLKSPYADKEVDWRPDGTWVYSYFQENANPEDRDKEATNRGLLKCMEDEGAGRRSLTDQTQARSRIPRSWACDRLRLGEWLFHS